MVSLADFQPQSIAKTNVFDRQLRFYRQLYHSAMPELGFVDSLCDSTSFRRLKFQKFHAKDSHIN